MKTLITAERLRALLEYDPDTGIFRWRPGRRRVPDGMVAGAYRLKGYIDIRIDQRGYGAHRLAWMYVHGVWPVVIDHVNGNRSDNRICNLRSVTHGENLQNRKGPGKRSKTGLLGVCFSKKDRVYVAAISLNNKTIRVAHSKDPQVAYAAYLEAKRRLHPANTL